MDDNTTRIIKEKFDSLPLSIQEVILSTHYQDTLIEIAKNYQLNVEQMGVLELETTLVMMGLTPTKNFEGELSRELKIDIEKGLKIVKEINEKIFVRIRELLKIMNGEKIEESTSIDESVNTQAADNDILNSAGIKIVPGQLELNTGEKSTENGDDMLKTLEDMASDHKEEPAPVKPKAVDMHPMLAQKMSSSVKIPMSKTEYSLSNLSKSTTPVAPNITPKRLSADPYREIPE